MKIALILILSLVLVTLCLAGSSHHGKNGRRSGSKRHNGHHVGPKKGQLKHRSRRGASEEVRHSVVKKENPEQKKGQDFVLDGGEEEQNSVDILGRSGRTFWPFTDWNSYYYSHPRVYHYSRPYYSGAGGFGTRRRGWWPAGWANSG